MAENTTQAATHVAPPLGDIGTRALARWLAQVAITGTYPRSLVEVMTRRHARIDDIRVELVRRETLGAGVR